MQVVMYGSAIFYNISGLPEHIQKFFYLNPIFTCIAYFRTVVIKNNVPDLYLHCLLAFYAITLLLIGCYIYKKYNYRFLYYV